jgi:hypothetical protein
MFSCFQHVHDITNFPQPISYSRRRSRNRHPRNGGCVTDRLWVGGLDWEDT